MFWPKKASFGSKVAKGRSYRTFPNPSPTFSKVSSNEEPSGGKIFSATRFAPSAAPAAFSTAGLKQEELDTLQASFDEFTSSFAKPEAC